MTVFRIRLLLLLGLLASPASAQDSGGHLGTVTPHRPALENGPAVTYCLDGRATSAFRGPLPPDVLEQLMVHEEVHRRQLAGDCDRVLRAILSDSLHHADAEAEAGCRQLDASVQDLVHRTFEFGNLHGWMYQRFPTLPRGTLDNLIARRCGLWRRS